MKQLIFVLLIIFATTVSYSQQNQTFSGNYSSVMGRMDPLSCYCYNGGYLTSENEEVVKICFDNMDISKVKNGKITVSGHFEKITHESTPMDPCPAGTRNIFIVKHYQLDGENIPVLFEEWKGIWTTNYGDLNIKVNGNELTGSYPKGKLKGKLIKTETGSEIRGEWYQAESEGWFFFYKDNKEDIFMGEWGYAGEESPAEGEWKGQK